MTTGHLAASQPAAKMIASRVDTHADLWFAETMGDRM